MVLHGPIRASASGSTENRGLLTSQALLVQQASFCGFLCKVLLLPDCCLAAKMG